MKPRSPALQANSLLSEPPGKSQSFQREFKNSFNGLHLQQKSLFLGEVKAKQTFWPTQYVLDFKIFSNYNPNYYYLDQMRQQGYKASVQFSSVAQLRATPYDPMNHSTPGLPVHHQLLEFTQTHVHRVSDAIQPSHPLSSLSPPAPNPSQHQGLFQ